MTLEKPAALHIGAGDEVTARSTNFYIVARQSDTEFLIQTATGEADINFKNEQITIKRAFNSLNDAINTKSEPNASDTNHLGTSNLTSGNIRLHIVCYGDAMEDVTPVTVGGWTTSETAAIFIEAAAGSRNQGRWDDSAYRLMVSGSTGIIIEDDNVTVTGLQIEIESLAKLGGGIVSFGTNNFNISGNIIRYTGVPAMARVSGIWAYDNKQAGVTGNIFNNIIYDFTGTGNYGIYVDFTGAGSKAYVYSNTVYNNTVGLAASMGTNTIAAKNNIAYLNTTNYGNAKNFDAASTNNLSGPRQSNAPGKNAVNNAAVTFANEAADDFRLAVNDNAAKDKGAQLSADADLPFTKDIKSETRTRAWDIGAHELGVKVIDAESADGTIIVEIGSAAVSEHVRLTFSDGDEGLSRVQKGQGGTWGPNLIGTDTLFTVGGESGTITHKVILDTSAQVTIRKTSRSVISEYHIFPSGRIVINAAGSNGITVNHTQRFSEYADGIASIDGYYAYVDLVETAASASVDFLMPDVPSAIAGARDVSSVSDYNKDGFGEGSGLYHVSAAADSAAIDFDGDTQTRYSPALAIQRFYPTTRTDASILVLWNADDSFKNGGEIWSGSLTTSLKSSTGLRGKAQANSAKGQYAALKTSGNINAGAGTLSLWVKSLSAENPYTNEYVLYAGEAFNIFFDVSGALNFRTSAQTSLQAPDDIYDSNWHNVTCLWDYAGDNYALYVDGVLKGESSAAQTAPALTADMILTAKDADGVMRFAGAIDELRVYDGIVSPTGHALYHSDHTRTPGVRVGDTVPAAGNIDADIGTLELRYKTDTARNPSKSEYLFKGRNGFSLFVDASGRVNFEISDNITIKDDADTYDGNWHHARAIWDYTNARYMLYVDGEQVAASTSTYTAGAMNADMVLGASNASGSGAFGGEIKDALIYDDAILPYGAFNVPLAWGDEKAPADPTVLAYWSAQTAGLDIGEGQVIFGGISAGDGVNGNGITNSGTGAYAVLPSEANVIAEEGSLGFWFKSYASANPAETQYLLYISADFNVACDAAGALNFTVNSEETLNAARDSYDGKWHYARATWNYTNNTYALYLDGVKRDASQAALTAPAIDTPIYITAKNASGTGAFAGSFDELYITNTDNTPATATASGKPIMQAQLARALSYRLDAGADLSGLDGDKLLTPYRDYAVAAGNSASEVIIQYFGNITTSGTPRIGMDMPAQTPDQGTVTIDYTGTDPDNDTVYYVEAGCEYSVDSTDGEDGTWVAMTSEESKEEFTSRGAELSYIWDAKADTQIEAPSAYVRLKVKDEMGHESVQVTSEAFAVDTLAPQGMTDFTVSKVGTKATLTWKSPEDAGWINGAHYEIWYGTKYEDVVTRNENALKWAQENDMLLTSRKTKTTAITGLLAGVEYYFAIWAVDGFGNETEGIEAIVGTISAAGEEPVGEIQPIEEVSAAGEEVAIEDLLDNQPPPAGAKLYDVLIKLGDNHHIDPAEDAAASYKHGDVVMVRPNGHKWTKTEQNSFLIVQMYMTEEEAKELAKPEIEILNGKGGRSIRKVINRRKKKVDMDAMGVPASDVRASKGRNKLKELRGGLKNKAVKKGLVKEKKKVK